jgi:hypothetical protein
VSSGRAISGAAGDGRIAPANRRDGAAGPPGDEASPRADLSRRAAEGKIVSVFEPSTEVIRKGKAAKPTEFGKMIKLQEAETQIVVDYEVYDRRPYDSDVLIPSIETRFRRNRLDDRVRSYCRSPSGAALSVFSFLARRTGRREHALPDLG